MSQQKPNSDNKPQNNDLYKESKNDINKTFEPDLIRGKKSPPLVVVKITKEK
jgi:hypothetical protein